MPFNIVRQDITKIKVDAIVNTINTDLQMGGGACGAIFTAAGAAQLQAACDQLAPIKVGDAVITPAFGLPAKFVIHTTGPIFFEHNKEQCQKDLFAAYTNSLKIAVENNCGSIAFPLISSGIYGYPKADALNVATSAIQNFLIDNDIDVTLAVYDKAAFSVSQERLWAVESYIDEHYIEQHKDLRQRLSEKEQAAIDNANKAYSSDLCFYSAYSVLPKSSSLGRLIGALDESFSEMLLRLIDAKGMSDVAVYKRANLDRKLFSKIRSNKGYMPSKRTAIALAIALKLSLDETDDLLERAGYALSHAIKFDVIIEYFIVNKNYNIFEINEVLFEYDQPLLGG